MKGMRVICAAVIAASALSMPSGGPASAQANLDSSDERSLAARKSELLTLLRRNPKLAKAIYDDLSGDYGVAKPAKPSKSGKPTKPGAAEPSSADLFSDAIKLANLNKPAPAKPAVKKDKCEEAQRLFIRKDNLDSWFYGVATTDKAVGASIAFTDNRISNARTAQIDGFAAYVLGRDPCDGKSTVTEYEHMTYSGYVFAPWTSAHGNLNSANAKSERSNWKNGIDAQVEFAGGLFDTQYFTITPYHQTDFRGIAEIYGLNAHWDATRLEWRLGGNESKFSDVIDWYWQLRLEADLRNVKDPGLTSLARGDYAWLGGTLRWYAFLFPGAQFVPPELRDRVKFVGTFYYFRDVNSSKIVSRTTAELVYNIAPDGSTSVSLQYDKGTDKDTLTDIHQYVVKLNYKY